MLTITDIAVLTRLSRSTIYRLIGCGRFPKPLKIGRASRWRAADIDAWITRLK